MINQRFNLSLLEDEFSAFLASEREQRVTCHSEQGDAYLDKIEKKLGEILPGAFFLKSTETVSSAGISSGVNNLEKNKLFFDQLLIYLVLRDGLLKLVNTLTMPTQDITPTRSSDEDQASLSKIEITEIQSRVLMLKANISRIVDDGGEGDLDYLVSSGMKSALSFLSEAICSLSRCLSFSEKDAGSDFGKEVLAQSSFLQAILSRISYINLNSRVDSDIWDSLVRDSAT
ncbi:MAG TPA: hypothetical protein PKA63_05850 [Oligoflexia bacterium]|nr:hypothetical protein [Oligoflexia bacterium]HMP48173.1 hypothetical protein [Oligoflexia bacterium]